MKENEASLIVAYEIRSFPCYYRNATKQDVKNRIISYMENLGHVNFEDVNAAVHVFVASDVKGYPPSIGQINAVIAEKLDKDIPSESVAWEKVRKAACNSSYCSAEEFNKLDPIIRKTLGSPSILREWAMMTQAELNTVVASNFQRSYRAEVEKQKRINRLSEKEKLGLVITNTEAPVALIPKPQSSPKPSGKKWVPEEDWMEEFMRKALKQGEEMKQKKNAETEAKEKSIWKSTRQPDWEKAKKKALEQIEWLKAQEDSHG